MRTFEDFIEARQTVENSAAFQLFEEEAKRLFNDRLNMLLSTEPENVHEISQIVGELRVYKNIIPNFERFLEENIRRTDE